MQRFGGLVLGWWLATSLSSLLQADEQIAQAENSGSALSTTGEQAKVQAALRNLISPSFQARRTAFLQLWELGSQALPALRLAAASENRQLAEMASSLMLLNELQVVRGNEQASSRLVELLNNLNSDKIVGMCELGYWDLATRLLLNNQELKQELSEGYAQFARNRLVDAALAQGELERVWPIVLATQAPEVTSWVAHKLELELPELVVEDVGLRAVRLYFAGEVEQALQLNLPPNRLIPMITRSFQWEEFLKPDVQSALIGMASTPATHAARAVLMEMGGDWAQAEAKWNEVLTARDGSEPDQGDAPELDAQSRLALSLLRAWGDPLRGRQLEQNQLIVALLMSGRVAPIERFLEETNGSWAYSFYAARSNYGKAFQQLGLDPSLEDFDQWLELQKRLVPNTLAETMRSDLDAARVAAVLVGLGEQAKAEQLLKALANIARTQREYELVIWQSNIMRWLGRHESRALCMRVVTENYDFMSEECQQVVLEGLFPEFKSAAAELFTTAPININGLENLSPWILLEKLHSWDREFFGTDAESVVSQWLRSAKQNLIHTQITSEQLTKLAAVARGFSYDHLALEILSTDLREVNSDGVLNVHWLDAAEIHLEQFKPQKALELLSLLRSHGYNFQPAYVREVEALLQTGEYTKARELDRSRWLRTLDESRYNGASYSDMSQYFSERGDVKRTLEYAEPAFLFAETSSRFVYWAAAAYASQLEELKNYQRAANVQRAPLVEALQPYSPLVQLLIGNGYIGNLRYSIQKERLTRGIACVEQSDFEAARRHLAVSKSLQPQDIEVVVQCYPRLVQAGETTFAQELFNDYEQTLLAQLEAWPNDSTALNNLAWMYARCNRKLEEALALAKRGVELAPSSPVFLDTLAEVKYRLGSVDEAIKDMRGCVRLDPRSANYRANLVRFREGRP